MQLAWHLSKRWRCSAGVRLDPLNLEALLLLGAVYASLNRIDEALRMPGKPFGSIPNILRRGVCWLK